MLENGLAIRHQEIPFGFKGKLTRDDSSKPLAVGRSLLKKLPGNLIERLTERSLANALFIRKLHLSNRLLVSQLDSFSL
jgi:hypothetical protein